MARGKPLCVIARTVKGWGVPSLGGMGHHGTPVSKDKLEAVLAELDKRAGRTRRRRAGRGREPGRRCASRRRCGAPRRSRRDSRPASTRPSTGDAKLAEAVNGKKALSPRRASGVALKALGAANPRVVALDADVKNSTYAQDFAGAYPDRYLRGAHRRAEHDLGGGRAGERRARSRSPAPSGASSNAAFDQIEMAIIGGADIKLVGTHVGVTLASDGPSQMALADVGFSARCAHARDVRGNPAVTVLTPSDAVSAYELVLAMADFPSACYLRAARADLPILYDEGETFPFGGHKVLRQADESRGAGGSCWSRPATSCIAASRRPRRWQATGRRRGGGRRLRAADG